MMDFMDKAHKNPESKAHEAKKKMAGKIKVGKERADYFQK